MQRRYFLGLLGVAGFGGLATYGCAKFKMYWPDDSTFFNSCLDSQLPAKLANHEVLLSALAGIDTTQMWDGHVHLLGRGENNSGIKINPKYSNILNVIYFTQSRFYLNAACALPDMPIDAGVVARLKSLQWGRGSRFLLLAYDYTYDKKGVRLPEQTAFYVPNYYAAQVHQQFPQVFEWIASIHPYRRDCVAALEKAFRAGARGVKWLPPAMGIDPNSAQCDRFYEALVYWNIPLLCHCGDESAVAGADNHAYGNPLLLRRALEHGVKVIVAHCASLGTSPDLDKGPNGPQTNNLDLFARLMDAPSYQGLLFGDISAITLINRSKSILETIITRSDWHPRLLYGSDYPLPGIVPLISLQQFVERQYINAEQADILAQLRFHNQLLFDFVLKRTMQVQGKRFSTNVFHTRPMWTGVNS